MFTKIRGDVMKKRRLGVEMRAIEEVCRIKRRVAWRKISMSNLKGKSVCLNNKEEKPTKVTNNVYIIISK
jgi:hypothetical protein